MCFFDVDEFLMLDEKFNNDIKKFLRKKIFNTFDGIRVCWKNYDDSNLVKVENDDYNCLTRFKNARPHTHCKTIFRT
jgi:hypothetical protein